MNLGELARRNVRGATSADPGQLRTAAEDEILVVRGSHLGGARVQHAGGDSLQQPHWRPSEIPVDDERGANVQRASRESGSQDCEQRVGILQ
jgi:hypothetical protein